MTKIPADRIRPEDRSDLPSYAKATWLDTDSKLHQRYLVLPAPNEREGFEPKFTDG
jgi:hypothetical protein